MASQALSRRRAMWRCLATAAALVAVAALAAPAGAVSIEFAVTPLGGDAYRYDYRVANDDSLGGAAIALFDVLFPTDLYAESSLAIATLDPPASDWSELLLASLPGVPAAYDALALGAGIPVGGSVAGFAVEFTWLGGPSGPGAQDFEIFDPGSFALLESGTTTPIPEPGTLALLALGLVACSSRGRRSGRG